MMQHHVRAVAGHIVTALIVTPIHSESLPAVKGKKNSTATHNVDYY